MLRGDLGRKEIQKRGDICICIDDSYCCTAETNTNIVRKGKIYTVECRVPKNSKERLKKAFLRDQCKEIEENNRMGKTGDLFKKIGDIKVTFHARMGMKRQK